VKFSRNPLKRSEDKEWTEWQRVPQYKAFIICI